MADAVRPEPVAEARASELRYNRSPGLPERAASRPYLRARSGTATIARRTLLASSVDGLQRTVGNRAVQRILRSTASLVQRGDPPAAAPTTAPAAGTPTEWKGGPVPADMVTASPPAVPKMSGVTSAALNGSMTTITGPKAVMTDVQLTLNKAAYSIATGKIVQGGFVQTVKVSDRRAVYEQPAAKPDDAPVQFEENVGTTGAHRDVSEVNSGGTVVPAAQAPFFLPPGALTADNPSVSVSGIVPGRDAFDQPSMTVANTIGAAKLVAVKGQESFQTSFGVKGYDDPPGSINHLSRSAWSLPWDVQGLGALAEGDKASGKGGRAGASNEAPSVVDGDSAKKAAHSYLAFSSLEAAMTQSPSLLLDNLPKAEAAGDEDTAAFTSAALKQKNPRYSITVTCLATDTLVGSDKMRFHVGKTKADVSMKIKEQGTAEISFNLNDVAEGPIGQADATVWIDLGGSALESTLWKLSKSHLSETLKVGTGSYALRGAMVS